MTMAGLVIKDWNIQEMTGYEPQTTFFTDFSIADMFGLEAIKDTYARAFKYWKDDVKFVTELSMVLNWKGWQHHGEGNKKYSEWYFAKWEELHDWCLSNLKGDDLTYYLRTTD